MSIHLLDSNVLIRFLRGDAAHRKLVRELVLQGHLLGSCPVTIAEVYSGMHPREEEPTAEFIGSLRFLPVTMDASIQAGKWRKHYRSMGLTLAVADTLIAATSAHYGCVLVTDNVRDFPMPELKLLSL